PRGTVFSSTVLRIPVPERTPPFALAYVDVDDGPRILAHVDGAGEGPAPGSRVALSGWTELGDPVVRELTPERAR
ncbi:MAG: OB-fold domain-containing protein, partial [bacterium]|nr:OB-fold domain-containing protein [bacterium]